MIRVMGIVKDGQLVSGPDDPELPRGSVPGDPALAQRLKELRDSVKMGRDSFLWIGLHDPTKPEMDLIQELFELSKLQIDDAANSRQRAKVEFDYQKAFVVLKVLHYDQSLHVIETGQLSVWVGHGYAITVRVGVVSPMRGLVGDINESGALLKHGPLAILHAVMDRVVDEYLEVLDEISYDIATLEEAVFAPDRTFETEKIYELKRENLQIRRAVAPLAQIVNRSMQQESRLRSSVRPYFRDIGDHILRANDATDANDNLLLTLLMASTSLTDLQQNRDMRRISAWVAIAAVPTMIAGIYGMNFDDMPELHWAFGYPMVLLVMITVCSLLFIRFKKSGWL